MPRPRPCPLLAGPPAQPCQLGAGLEAAGSRLQCQAVYADARTQAQPETVVGNELLPQHVGQEPSELAHRTNHVLVGSTRHLERPRMRQIWRDTHLLIHTLITLTPAHTHIPSLHIHTHSHIHPLYTPLTPTHTHTPLHTLTTHTPAHAHTPSIHTHSHSHTHPLYRFMPTHMHTHPPHTPHAHCSYAHITHTITLTDSHVCLHT